MTQIFLGGRRSWGGRNGQTQKIVNFLENFLKFFSKEGNFFSGGRGPGSLGPPCPDYANTFLPKNWTLFWVEVMVKSLSLVTRGHNPCYYLLRLIFKSKMPMRWHNASRHIFHNDWIVCYWKSGMYILYVPLSQSAMCFVLHRLLYLPTSYNLYLST